jgi:glycosyltransferase involved in cell wall biosynthesis
MRIGIDARLNGYRDGGISEYTRNLIEGLARLDEENEYVILNAARTQTATGVLMPAANFNAVSVYTPAHHRIERWALAAEALRLRLEVLHSPDFIPPRFGARRKVITVHDLNFLYYPKFQTPDSLSYYAGQIKAAVRDADHILTVSQASVSDLVNMLDVPIEKISVQVEGVDAAFQPMAAEALDTVRKRLKLPQTYLLFVGTFEPRKNLGGLLDAYAALRHTMNDAPPLVIAGRRGWLYESIFQKVTDLGLTKYVRWIEDVASADLPSVYNGATALVLPSFYEGFGLPALEAMACGIPTVVSDRGSLPEVVGECGLLINPDKTDSIVEAMRRILTDDELRKRSIETGLTRATLFTWERAAEVALSVYQKVSDN